MFKPTLLEKLPAILVGISSLAVATCFAVNPALVMANFPLRLGMAAGLFGSLGLLAIHGHQRRIKTHQCIVRFADSLNHLDALDSCTAPLANSTAVVPKNSPWRQVCERIQQCLHAQRQRLSDAEHARASAEVRVKRLANELAQKKEILDGLSDPILAIDQYDELLLANPSACRLFHLDDENVERRAVRELLRCNELVALLTETRRRKTVSHRTGEISLSDENGEARCYRVTCNSMGVREQDDGHEKHASGVVAVLNDISNEKVIQKRNAQFVSAVSHEMKTPLAGIKAYVELLADGEAEDEATQAEFLGVISSQADRLRRLVENLLNLARIEAGVVEVNKNTCSLNELLDEASSVVQPRTEKKGVQLVKSLSQMYLGVLADRDMLLQATINLLSNAIKYTPEGGQVTLRSRLEDMYVVVEVTDTGVGLSDEDQTRIFDKFYRVKEHSTMASGTGLGLPLAKHIVEDVHGGQLTVESELGHGSTFRILLPSHGTIKWTRREEVVSGA